MSTALKLDPEYESVNVTMTIPAQDLKIVINYLKNKELVKGKELRDLQIYEYYVDLRERNKGTKKWKMNAILDTCIEFNVSESLVYEIIKKVKSPK